MLRSRSAGIVLLSGLLLSACAVGDQPRSPPPEVTARATAPFAVHVAHVDARLGLPSFVWLTGRPLSGSGTAHAPSSLETPADAARATIAVLAPALSWRPAALASLGEPVIHDVGQGPIVARYRQAVGGVEVFRGGLNLTMNRALEPVAASGLVVPQLSGADTPFTVLPATAVATAHHAMTGGAAAFTARETDGEYTHFAGDAALSLSRARRVLFPLAEGVVPGWHVELVGRRSGGTSFVVSAVDGEILFSTSLVHADAYTYRVYADAKTLIPMDGPQGNATIPHPTGKPDRYKPSFVPGALVTIANYPFSRNDPWLPPGASTTMGNNVSAYADLSTPDGLGGALDTQPALTSPSTFDYVYDTTASPVARPNSIRASITHLFYTTNFLHDWFYDAGFDEKSGNHQAKNLFRGGKENDPLLVEALDYSGKNNANATVPGDGASPRIQMFVFSGPSTAVLNVPPPSPVAGDKAVGLAGFGKDAFDVTAQVVVAADNADPDRADACDGELQGNIAGKIVLVHRGQCSFVQKAQAVQDQGAVGVVVVNVPSSADPGSPPFMGGTSDRITIPILSLNLADGQALEAAATTGTATVQMRRFPQVDLDGGLDTSIVAHEWGHVLSSRLIGNGSGLATNQAGGLGEGWADFLALLLVARTDDVETPAGRGWAGVYPKGAYATMGSGADYYFGIRRLPYSTDFRKNPLTFKHIQNGTPLPTGVPISFGEDGSFNAEVHATGEVWASMLWECYASLLAEGRLSYDEAQARMARYLVSAMKTTPVDPTLIEARDALLATSLAGDERDFQVFYQAFARRGAGVGASGPSKESTNNVGVIESFDVGNDIRIVSAVLVTGALTCDHDPFLDEGEVGAVEVVVRNVGVGALADTAVEISTPSPDVTFLDDKGRTVGTVRTMVGPLRPFETRTARTGAVVRGSKSGPIQLDVRVTDPTLLRPRVLSAPVQGRANTDEDQKSAIDSMEAKNTSWKVTGPGGAAIKWSRKATPADGTFWTVPDQPLPVEQRLTSAPFTIDEATFTLSFRHRHSFRHSTRRNVDVDGGVIELSVDNGVTWVDVSSVSDPKLAYPGKIDPGSPGRLSDNPLLKDVPAGQARPAYVFKSAGYPAWVEGKIAVALRERPKDGKVLIRFRTGSATGFFGAEGWDVDDVSLGGISSTPFWGFVPHADGCDAKAPSAKVLATPTPQKTLDRLGPAEKAMCTSTACVFVGDALRLTGCGVRPGGTDAAPIPVDPLGFTWTQVAGPPLTVRGGSAAPAPAHLAQACGEAGLPDSPWSATDRIRASLPEIDAPTTPATLSFVLRANDGVLVSAATSRIDVHVLPRPTAAPPPETGCGCSQTRSSEAPMSLALGVAVLAYVRRRRSGARVR